MRGEMARNMVQASGPKTARALVSLLVLRGMENRDAQRDIQNALDRGWLVLGNALQLQLPSDPRDER